MGPLGAAHLIGWDGMGWRPMMGGEFAKISDRFLEVPSPVSRLSLGTIVIMDDTS